MNDDAFPGTQARDGLQFGLERWLGRSGESYCGYVLKMELTGFANGLDIRDGRKEELG